MTPSSLLYPLPRPCPQSQAFGANRREYAAFGLPGHNGLDFAAPSGTPVLAAAAGRVKRAANDPPGYGLYVLLEHPGGFLTRYAHLAVFCVAAGHTVTAGQEIGRVGYTGNVRDAAGLRSPAAAHLHFELLRPGEGAPGYRDAVDPTPYLAAPAYPVAPALPPVALAPPTQPAAASGEAYRVTADCLNVRAGPGLQYAIIGSLQRGQVVVGLGLARRESWLQLAGKVIGGLTGGYAALEWGEETYLERTDDHAEPHAAP